MAGSKPLKDNWGHSQERKFCCNKACKVNAQPVMQEQGRFSMSGNV